MAKSMICFDESSPCDYFTLEEVLKSLDSNNPLQKDSSLWLLAARQVSDKQVSPKNRRRFYIQVWRDLSKVINLEKDDKVQLSISLLEASFSGADIISLQSMIDRIPHCPGVYFMVSIFGVFSEKITLQSKQVRDQCCCLGTVMAQCNEHFMVLSHIAVSKRKFTQVDFGQRSDGLPFRNRGLGQLLIGLSQCVYRSKFESGLHNNIYSWSLNENFENSIWEKLGFVECSIEYDMEWPASLRSFISEYSKFSDKSMYHDGNRVHLSIDTPVDNYAIFGRVGEIGIDPDEIHDLFKDPFIAGTAAEPISASLDDHQYTKQVFVHRCTHGGVMIESNARPYEMDLFELLTTRKESILFLSNTLETNRELFDMTHADILVPQVALDYCLLLLMLETKNLFTLSVNTVGHWYRSSFQDLFDSYSNVGNWGSFNYKGILAEMEFVKKHADNKEFKFIIPFFYDGHWVIIERVYLCNEIVFFFADSSDESQRIFNPSNNEVIPINIMWLFMDTPLWPLGSNAHWLCVPNIQQLELECGSRSVLHSYLMCRSSFPHLSLLCLHQLPKKKKHKFNQLCRKWVSDIIKKKMLLHPVFLPDVLSDGGGLFQYDQQWLKDHTICKCVDRSEYDLLKVAVRAEDARIGHGVFLEEVSNFVVGHASSPVEASNATTVVEEVIRIHDGQEVEQAISQVDGVNVITHVDTTSTLNITQDGDNNTNVINYADNLSTLNINAPVVTQERINSDNDSDSCSYSIGPAPWVGLPATMASVVSIRDKDRDEECLQDSGDENTSDKNRCNNKRLRQGVCGVCSDSIIGAYQKCDNCGKLMHQRCSFHVQEGNDDIPATVCAQCGEGKKRFHFSNLENQLLITLGCEDDYDVMLGRNSLQAVQRMKQINNCLSTTKFLRKKLISPNEFQYYAKTSSGLIMPINAKLLEDRLLFFFKDTMRRVNLNARRKLWIPLDDTVAEFINEHGRTFANDELFDIMCVCESKEWSYMKFNTWNQRRLSNDMKYILTDSKKEAKKKNVCWISLTNDRSSNEVPFAPLYFLLNWKHTCNVDRDENHPNEVEQLLEKAKMNAGDWIEIDAGSSRRIGQGNSFRYRNRSLPRSYRIQPYGENSCVVNSLLNAFHYINDWEARDILKNEIATSLSYSSYKCFAKGRREFAAYLVNFKVKGYVTSYMKQFDILNNRSIWPTLCILKGSDESVNHAVTIVEDYIFDSNCPYALQLTRENLDWCCNADDETCNITYVNVMFGYRFIRKSPALPFVLRGEGKNIHAFKSIVQCLNYIRDDDTVEILEGLKDEINPTSDIITIVRNVLTRKGTGYWPVCVASISQLEKVSSISCPTIVLIHAKGTYSYKVICVAENIIFEGSSRQSPYSADYLCSQVCPQQIIDVQSLQVVKGYCFKKKEIRRKKIQRSSKSSETLNGNI